MVVVVSIFFKCCEVRLSEKLSEKIVFQNVTKLKISQNMTFVNELLFYKQLVCEFLYYYCVNGKISLHF